MQREVTEKDLRIPEFREAKLEDLEFREDGKIVRKDRWERGIRRIVGMVGMSSRDFEIDEVIEKVRSLAHVESDWTLVSDTDIEDIPIGKGAVDIELFCGSVLTVATFIPELERWDWNRGMSYTHSQVKHWRMHIKKKVQS